MKSIHLILIGAIILISGDMFDTATTVIGLFNPIFTGVFVEVGNPFIKFLMYDLGLATTGFVIAIMISFSFDALMIYAAYSASRSYTRSNSFAWILLFMGLAGVGHWGAGYQNWMLLLSLGF